VRILFVASEGLPFSKTGGLADVIEALPRALVAQGHDVAVVLPRYRGTKIDSVLIPSLTVAMGGQLRFPAVDDGGVISGVQYFFVDDAPYFDRDALYGTRIGDYPDNPERYSEFCRVAIEIAKNVWRADLLHCHDWQAALVPVLLRTAYAQDPVAQNLAVLFTVHNIGYQGLFPRDALTRADIPVSTFHPGGIEFYGSVNLLKGGLVFSDYLTTVSRKYAEEIQTREFGYGLDGVIRARADRLVGILNGVDYTAWNPETDELIPARYSMKDLSGKQACREALLQLFGLPQDEPTPVVGIVSRFADQKGFDLVADRAHDLMQENLMLTVLGTGDRKYEDLFRALAASYPARVGVKIAYDETIAHQIEAGADMFLMPSRYEPCGLNQIYSLKYGTVPIVRATGGLDDTVEAFDVESGTGTGFKFEEYAGPALVRCVQRALQHYEDEQVWKRIQLNGMAKDFSWKGSAAEYTKVYTATRAVRRSGQTASSGRSATRNQMPVTTSN
jgi:starch synthase